MKKFIKLVSILCVIALLSSCGLVSKVENEPKTLKSELAVTIGDTEYNSQRFNYYFYNVQGETLVSAGYQASADVPKDFWTQKKDGKTNLEIAKERAVELLTQDAIAYQKAKEMGLTLSEEDKTNIQTTINNLKKDPEQLKIYEETIGISLEEIEKYLNEGYLTQHLMPELINKGEIKVDENEGLEKFRGEYVKAKHILISTIDSATGAALSEEEVTAAKAKAQDILNQLNNGADFDELMNVNSEDPGLATAPDGYVFTKGEMVAEFEEAAFALAEDKISGLVETSYGIHIIKRVPFDMTGSQETQILESIEYDIALPQFEKLVETWKSDYAVKKSEKFFKALKPFEFKDIFGA